MTKVVSLISESVDSFDWELPAKISAEIEKLPPSLQKKMMEQASLIVEAHAITILKSLSLGPLTPSALQLITERDCATKELLQKILSRL